MGCHGNFLRHKNDRIFFGNFENRRGEGPGDEVGAAVEYACGAIGLHLFVFVWPVWQ